LWIVNLQVVLDNLQYDRRKAWKIYTYIHTYIRISYNNNYYCYNVLICYEWTKYYA
jgi:hypothetical protein